MDEIIRSILVLSLMGGALALLLVIADATIAAYGECKIEINDERELTVTGGESLLTSLGQNKIFIPSACGGRGTCAYCKIKVAEGGGPVLPIELPYLTPEELKEGVRLSCQVKVRNDLRIEIPEDLFNVREYRVRVERVRDLTYDTKELRLALIEPETIRFKAGQYLQLRAPEYEGSRQEVYRAYSISSPPSDEGHIELVIRLVPDGICTTWVFNYLKEGDEVVLNGPYGDFAMRAGDGEIVFAAGGSGFAPIKAMLQDNPEDLNRRGTRFFFGANEPRDLFYDELMAEIASRHEKIQFIPVLAKPPSDSEWEGETGLITQALDKHLENADGKQFYLCGSPGMIDACVALFVKKGASEDAIFYDKFS